MARLIHSLAGRLGIIALLINGTLLPMLYVGLNAIVTGSEQDAHVTEMRTYARLVADQLELGGASYSDDQIRALLENVLISGDANYAELVTTRGVVRAALGPPGAAPQFTRDDFAFGTGGDDTYNLSVPIDRGADEGTLRIAFNEKHVMSQIHRTRAWILLALGAFFLISTSLAIFFGTRLARPLEELQSASRRVASGELGVTLETRSTIAEFHGLTDDLEAMRAELVSVGRQLQKEMRERDVAEGQRRQLEERLAGRRRLETVGTLAGGIAHEFNNILVPIQLYTEMAIDDVGPDSPVRDDLLRVQEAARRAKRIVSDILVFTRERQSEADEGVDVAEIATEVVRLYERLAPPGVRIASEIRADCPLAQGDAAMVHQVMFNLCSNACQAMAEGGGTLTVTAGLADADTVASSDLPPGPHVDICVRDTGHGIEESVRAHIFEPFFTTRKVGHGTGLGLSVVHGMVTSMGGAVVVDSEAGIGTEFHVLLKVFGLEGSGDARSIAKEVTT